jgi:hypothetical protein
MMRLWRRLDRWAARVNPGLAIVAVVLALVDGSIVLGQQATHPLPTDWAAAQAALSTPPPAASAPQRAQHDPAPDPKLADARLAPRASDAAPDSRRP